MTILKFSLLNRSTPAAARKKGKKEKKEPPSPPPLLADHVLWIFRGEYLLTYGRHVKRKPRTILRWLGVAVVALAGAMWIHAHFPQDSYWRLGSLPLLIIGGLSLCTGMIMLLAWRGEKRLLYRVIRWARRLSLFVDYFTFALIGVASLASIGIALYAAWADDTYDTLSLRAGAVELAYMAGVVLLASGGGSTRVLFSVVYGRPRLAFHVIAAATRVLVWVSLFVSVAELLAPGESLWMTAAATLFLSATGWEVARLAVAEQAVRRFRDAVTDLQRVGNDPTAHVAADLVAALATVENACLRRTLGVRYTVESEVAMIVRACLEALEEKERRVYPDSSVAANLQKDFMEVPHGELCKQITIFATCLRQCLTLHKPLVEGGIWAVPKHTTEVDDPETATRWAA